MPTIRSVTVYCSSSKSIDPVYFQAGRELGEAIAKQGWELIYGGNRVGLMGELAEASRTAGGRVVGITPKLFIDKGYGDSICDELIVTDGMRDRKALLEQRGDAFIALPGGLGTFEEIFDIIVHRQLGYHNKPIVLLNIDNYYDCLLALVEQGLAKNFVKSEAAALFVTAPNVESAIAYLKTYAPAGPAKFITPSSDAE